jgi:two-component system sensor histidine kinase ChvG
VKRIRGLFSRISLRLMLFNLLLVFLPVAGVLLLDIYEDHLENAQVQSMFRQARAVGAAMEAGGEAEFEHALPVIGRLPLRDGRFRVIDRRGEVVVDSARLRYGDVPPSRPENEAREHWLYRFGSALVRRPLYFLKGPLPLTSSDQYERSPVLMGREVREALSGADAWEKRVSSGERRQITIYAAVPVLHGTEVLAAVLVSRSTDDIRHDLQTVRLAVFRIFAFSVVAAIVLTLLVSTTIVRPLRQLRREANEILDRRGRLRGRFRGSNKRDEIGDLARALERLTRRLEQHQQFTESFAAEVSHEFKNPLASVRMATEMLAQVSDPAERARFLRIAESEIARLEGLLSEVREITMLDTELQKGQRTAVDLNALLDRVIEGFGMREQGRVNFRFERTDGPLEVSANEERLLQVFENVLDNAVSFSGADGVVSVLTAREGRSAVVTIGDSGPGIPQAHLERVFDRFFTWRPEGRERHSGLGLSIVKTIVEGYGGTVVARNRAGGGAEFEVRLPVA